MSRFKLHLILLTKMGRRLSSLRSFRIIILRLIIYRWGLRDRRVSRRKWRNSIRLIIIIIITVGMDMGILITTTCKWIIRICLWEEAEVTTNQTCTIITILSTTSFHHNPKAEDTCTSSHLLTCTSHHPHNKCHRTTEEEAYLIISYLTRSWEEAVRIRIRSRVLDFFE